MGFDPFTTALVTGNLPGQREAKAQKRALRDQRDAQAVAAAAAASEAQRAEAQQRRANRRAPDVAALLEAARARKSNATLLTGTRGVERSALSLGGTTLLGA